MAPESPYRRGRLAPRCRLITSWLWRGFQGFVCSPIKVVRELGLERRETVRSLSTAGGVAKPECVVVREEPTQPGARAAVVPVRRPQTHPGASQPLDAAKAGRAPAAPPRRHTRPVRRADPAGREPRAQRRRGAPPFPRPKRAPGVGPGATLTELSRGTNEYDYSSERMRARRLTHASLTPARRVGRGWRKGA